MADVLTGTVPWRLLLVCIRCARHLRLFCRGEPPSARRPLSNFNAKANIGTGFAVVAIEIRSLASRVGDAEIQIEELIGTAQNVLEKLKDDR